MKLAIIRSLFGFLLSIISISSIQGTIFHSTGRGIRSVIIDLDQQYKLLNNAIERKAAKEIEEFKKLIEERLRSIYTQMRNEMSFSRPARNFLKVHGLLKNNDLKLSGAAAINKFDQRIKEKIDELQKINENKKNCGICYSEKSKEEFVKLGCNHNEFCSDCLRGYMDEAIKVKNSKIFKCPDPDCLELILPDLAKDIGIEGRWEKFNQILFEEWVANNRNVTRQCPTPACTAVFSSDVNVARIYRCFQCDKRYCTKCLILHDQNITCEAAKKQRDADDKKTIDLIKKLSKPCPKCKTPIEKESGCNRIQCAAPGCNVHFCWVCTNFFSNNSQDVYDHLSKVGGCKGIGIWDK